VAITGAAFGGIGAGVLLVAQGAYFRKLPNDMLQPLAQELSVSTAYLAGVFAFTYLSFEVLLRALSSVLASFVGWRAIFGVYTTIALVTTMGMTTVINYPNAEDAISGSISVFHKVTAALQLLGKGPENEVHDWTEYYSLDLLGHS
jgi:hypothetical protein